MSETILLSWTLLQLVRQGVSGLDEKDQLSLLTRVSDLLPLRQRVELIKFVDGMPELTVNKLAGMIIGVLCGNISIDMALNRRLSSSYSI